MCRYRSDVHDDDGGDINVTCDNADHNTDDDTDTDDDIENVIDDDFEDDMLDSSSTSSGAPIYKEPTVHNSTSFVQWRSEVSS